jgi:hypothetical protein
MSDKQTTQSQHDAAQDPVLAGIDFWAELARRGMERWTACWGELAGMESRVHEQSASVLQETARLQAEAMKFALDLARESRRLALEAARRAADPWTPA